MHPSVVKFSTPWHGYTYWMSMTPLTGGNDRVENPEILVSNDGDTWEVPPGLTNPIDAAPPAPAFNSDSELVYNATEDKLYCFYRHDNADGTGVLRLRTSSDGVTWSDEEDIIAASNVGSPAIVHDGTQWIMYSSQSGSGAINRRTAATLAGPWSDATRVTFVNVPSAVGEYWHVGAVCKDGITTLFINEQSDDLWLFNSANGLTFDCAAAPILTNGTGNWDNKNLYRSCAVAIPGGFELWYTGVSDTNEWHTGRTLVILTD